MLTKFGAERRWVYPARITGRFQRLHRISGAILLAILLVFPWIRIDGLPLLLLDIPARRFFLFGAVFTPRDSVLLLCILLLSALALFFFTSLFGRLWCGYGCPQTVLLEEIIRPLERKIEGNRGARRRLDNQPWSLRKARIKGLKWLAFAVVSVVIGASFASIFVDAYELWTLEAGSAAYLFAGSIAAFLFLDFVWFREQFCNYLCPYARFQGALTDAHSLTVGYDALRGEPRKERGAKLLDQGACIDCNKCVSVCPQGIDIRDGFQLECVNCGRCVDACEDVMGRLGQPSLVRYASEAELTGKEIRKVRARPLIYVTLLTAVLAVTIGFLATRGTFDVTISQDRASATQLLSNQAVRNLYQLTVFNNATDEATFRITASGLDDATVVVPGGTVTVPGTSRRTVPVFVTIPSGRGMPAVTQFEFIVVDVESGDEIRRTATFRNALEANHEVEAVAPRDLSVPDLRRGGQPGPGDHGGQDG